MKRRLIKVDILSRKEGGRPKIEFTNALREDILVLNAIEEDIDD